MTVQELINQLQTLPPETKVEIVITKMVQDILLLEKVKIFDFIKMLSKSKKVIKFAY